MTKRKKPVKHGKLLRTEWGVERKNIVNSRNYWGFWERADDEQDAKEWARHENAIKPGRYRAVRIEVYEVKE